MKKKLIYHEALLKDVLENVQAPDNICPIKCTDVGYLQRNRAQTQLKKAVNWGY